MFNALPMIQNSISATSEAMTLLSTDAQAFQTDCYKQQRYSFSSIFNKEVQTVGGRFGRFGGANNQTMSTGVTLIPMGYDMSQGGIRNAQAIEYGCKRSRILCYAIRKFSTTLIHTSK